MEYVVSKEAAETLRFSELFRNQHVQSVVFSEYLKLNA